MEQNPYESPQEAGDVKKSDRNIIGLRRKSWLGYAVALATGAFLAIPITVFAPIDLAALDDTGFTQMVIGGFVGVLVYALLFPLRPAPVNGND